MANPNIGSIPCPIPTCDNLAAVRRASVGARTLYLMCEDCGKLTPNRPRGQAWIKAAATFYADDSAGDSEPPQAAGRNEKSAENSVTENPRRKGVLGGIDL